MGVFDRNYSPSISKIGRMLRLRIDISENEPETLMQQDADINCRRCLIDKVD